MYVLSHASRIWSSHVQALKNLILTIDGTLSTEIGTISIYRCLVGYLLLGEAVFKNIHANSHLRYLISNFAYVSSAMLRAFRLWCYTVQACLELYLLLCSSPC